MKLLAPTEIDVAGRTPGDLHVLDYVMHAADAIGNVTTCMRVLDTGTHLLPVTINEGGEASDNSYVVSPLTTYTGYADYEMGQFDHPLLAWTLRQLVRGMGTWLLRAQIDRIVQVNNWLLSTNLYPPEWSGDDLSEITRLLMELYPDHVIGFRSLNRHSNVNRPGFRGGRLV